MPPRIRVARIGAAHGVRGEVRLHAFTEDPLAVARYGPLEDEGGTRRFKIASLRSGKDHLIARLEGVRDRGAAAKLANLTLYVPRDRLPAIEDAASFYRADLVGLRVETRDGAALGEVVAVENFGAGDVLEVKPPRGESVTLPFVEAFVLEVDVLGGRIVAEPPAGLFETTGARPRGAPRGAPPDPWPQRARTRSVGGHGSPLSRGRRRG
jgi:16S rRNA processing protein RimM